MSVDTWLQSILSATPSPVATDDVIDVGTYDHHIIKPEPLKPSLNDFSMQLAQLQMMWQPMQQFLALCQLNTSQLPSPVEFHTKIHDQVPNPRKRLANSPDAVVPRKQKIRKLEEDTVTASPVSGMFIKEEADLPPPEQLQRQADTLDETAAYVEVSDESKRKVASIENIIGDCVCRLCKVKYDDVFKLAQHRCPRISHEEYKCPECDKIFSCPANLASHRRWHRPREPTDSICCPTCVQVFSTKKQYKNHLAHCQTPSLVNLPFSITGLTNNGVKLEMH